MVLVLLLDVATNRAALRRAHCKSAVTFLPCESGHTNLIMHPTRRDRLQFAKHISQPVRRAQPDQHMHMVRNAANAIRNSARRANDSAKVRMKVCAPCTLNERLMIFGSENDVIMQAQMGGRHIGFIYHAPLGLGICLYSRRWFPPQANVQNPFGIGFDDDEMVTTPLPKRSTPDFDLSPPKKSRSRNCNRLHERLRVLRKVRAKSAKKIKKKLVIHSFIR